MRLYDVKYKGERILYELGLQEAIAHYAGNDPTQSGTAYLGKILPPLPRDSVQSGVRGTHFYYARMPS
jgi:hypothetical protein